MLDMHSIRKTANIIFIGAAMALLMTATAFAATSGRYKVPTREGYEFLGWYLNPDGTGDMVIDKNGNWLQNFDDNARVYAKWKEKPTVLEKGTTINGIFKSLSGTGGHGWNTEDTLITAIVRSEDPPQDNITKERISTYTSGHDVWAWYDNGTIYWYTAAETVSAGEKPSYMFSKLKALESLDVSGWNWDMSSATTMQQMFFECSSLRSVNLNGWDVSNVTSLQQTFNKCTSLTSIDLSSWNIEKLVNTGNLFGECTALQSADLSGWKFGEQGSANSIFHKCSSLTTVKLDNWDTSTVTNMGFLFNDCRALTSVDLSSFNTSAVTNMEYMFYDNRNLEAIYASELWDVSNVTKSNFMFFYNRSLPRYNDSYRDKTRAYYGGDGLGYLTYKAAPSTP